MQNQKGTRRIGLIYKLDVGALIKYAFILYWLAEHKDLSIR
jgi:hypothetical protein